jgi:hypothetical protein
MRKVAILIVCLLFIAALSVCGRAFAQNDAIDSEESLKALGRSEASIIDSVPIQAPADLSEEIKDEEAVDSDS